MVLNDNKIKIYTPSMVSKYLEIFLNYFMDCLIFLFIPIVLMPFKLDFNIVSLCMILIMVLYYKKINKNYFPFLLEMYKNKVRIRNYDDSFWKPFFMAKFIDVTIDFKDFKDIKFVNIGFEGTVYIYLKNKNYFIISNRNGKTLSRFYNDLKQELEEYKKTA